jgi:hypothetical protein
MDHTYIAEHGLVERYHRGLLPPEEEASFEEHFVTCAECMEQLELARGFQKGLKTAVAEDVAQAALARAGLFAWLARRSRLAQLGLAVLLLSLLSLPSLLSLRSSESQRLASERLEAERRTTQELRQRLSESERQRTEERRTLEGKLAEAGKVAPPEAPRGLPGPLVNTPVFLLTALRGEGEPAIIDRSQAGDVLALAVDVGADPGFESYRVTITRGDRVVLKKDGLRPNALETLMITFPSSFFLPGEHRLRVEGVRPGGEISEIGGYPFRIR